ncbi:FtsX-like permease family protein [Gemmobacter lutimaris]|uniref:FtsX-like permease family protein n=1 Tax=Gemmobacter lutimaris TaxID=2306023 RepID=A0A398BLL2_9RHOB|nr:FtsX-like permease family protein [Gemmobacter lutimaris]RID90554.1 FtsX-like permease family protein [Gemmobacter lutimaris]
MSWPLAIRLARRELRGGIRGFRIFLACIALGVAAIAAVGELRGAIHAGLDAQGAVLLGGDAQMEFTYRYADDDERAFMAGVAGRVSEVVDFRSMLVAGAERGLTQITAVDDLYPLKGEVLLDPPMPLAEALAPRDGLPGAVIDPVLMDRLGLAPGATVKLGTQAFRVAAALIRQPDSATGGFGLGPPTLVRSADLANSGLLVPGALFETKYRLDLPPGTDLDAVQAAAESRFTDKGLRWRDSRRAAPGVERFVDRIGSFLVLVGLAGLAVGGVGVSAAVRAWAEEKVPVIATLKTLGAESGLIFRLFLVQAAVLAAVGVVIGLVLGALVPVLAGPLIAGALPFPVEFAVYPGPLVEAAFYGLITALLFTLWPLAQVEHVRAAALYRGAGRGGLPAPGRILAIAALAALLIGAAVWLSGMWGLALGTAGGVAASLGVLALAGLALRRVARGLARRMRGRVALRAALGAIAAPRGEALPVVLSLGLGLSVLAAVGQIDANLRAAIDRDLPTRAPAYFFVDIQPDQIGPFLDRVNSDPAISRVESAPMLRGVITQINGRPAKEVAGDHWVVRGDRGLTYAETPPEGTKVVAGDWWPKGYDGPPQISFSAEEAAEIGLKLGDSITVNVLGRDITATVTSLRAVDFATGGMGFVMTMNPGALSGAPHTHIATIYAPPQDEARILRDLAGTWPNITAIRVRDAIARVTEALDAIATATAWAAAAVLATGFVVLIGAAAAGERARVYEAAVLKVLGATRGRILLSFALRAGLTGAAAGLVAIFAGGVAGWAVMRFVMDAPFAFEPWSALAIVAGGVGLTLLAGLAFALRPLGVRPARVLRAGD